jgi:DNA/RNA-binding domain of Phe-tRNA-synthetase-like protein
MGRLSVRVEIDPTVADLAIGLVETRGVTVAAADEELTSVCRQWVQHVASDGPQGGDQRRQAVRRLLRAGGFKPSGRSKPAQEYLLRAAREDAWPVISNVVDVLNVVSLRSGLPISLLSVSRVGSPLLVRYGRDGERYVFNASGHELDLHGLICVCGRAEQGTEAMGSPVKDSQHAKVTAEDSHLLACLFAPRSAVTPETLAYWCAELESGWRRYCQAPEVETGQVPASW